MVRSATDLFTRVGYAGTTMEGIAAGAGMSVQSVYFAFHTKANLLQAAIDAATPEPDPRPMETDPDLALAELVDEACRLLGTTGPLALAAAAAGPRDAAADEVLRRYETARSKAASDLVARLRSKRPLAIGVTTPSGVRRGLRPAQPPAPRAAGARTGLVAEALRRMGR